MISGWPGTPGFLGKNDAKIWKGGDSCAHAYMQLLNSLMDAQCTLWRCCCIRDYGRKKNKNNYNNNNDGIMEGAILLVSVSVM